MLSHLNELDLWGLFLTEQWSRSGCHLVKKKSAQVQLVYVWEHIKVLQIYQYSLVRGHHIRSGNFEMLSCLNELELCGLFLTEEWSRSGCHSVKKSPHKSDSFRRDSISKLPGLIWWPQTKGKNVHRLTPWQFWNAVKPKRVGLVRTFFTWMIPWPTPLFS